MSVLRQISRRNQLTLPAEVLSALGLRAGDWVEVSAEGTALVVRPKLVEDPCTQEDLRAFDRLVRRQRKAGRYREFSSAGGALRHVRSLGRC
jgi:AbrB family looped-hinge helix DNA binding protein